jgi:hypothetical protein
VTGVLGSNACLRLRERVAKRGRAEIPIFESGEMVRLFLEEVKMAQMARSRLLAGQLWWIHWPRLQTPARSLQVASLQAFERRPRLPARTRAAVVQWAQLQPLICQPVTDGLGGIATPRLCTRQSHDCTAQSNHQSSKFESRRRGRGTGHNAGTTRHNQWNRIGGP